MRSTWSALHQWRLFFLCFLVYLIFCRRYHGLLDGSFSFSRSKIAEVNMACSAMRIGCRFYVVLFSCYCPLLLSIFSWSTCQESSGGGSLSGMCGNFYLPTLQIVRSFIQILSCLFIICNNCFWINDFYHKLVFLLILQT